MFPRIGDGYWADVKVNERMYFRLFATETGLGPGSAVYDMVAKKWFLDRSWAETIEDAQRQAESYARVYYRATGFKDPFPAIQWKKTGDR